VYTSGYPSVFISHYNGQELSYLDHCLLWITLATTLVYPTVDSGLTIRNTYNHKLWFLHLCIKPKPKHNLYAAGDERGVHTLRTCRVDQNKR